MCGVDLLDSFAAKYKFPMKSRRWYSYIFWHIIILAVINAWLLYQLYCKALNVPKKNMLETVSGTTSFFSHPGKHSCHTKERAAIFSQ